MSHHSGTIIEITTGPQSHIGNGSSSVDAAACCITMWPHSQGINLIAFRRSARLKDNCSPDFRDTLSPATRLPIDALRRELSHNAKYRVNGKVTVKKPIASALNGPLGLGGSPPVESITIKKSELPHIAKISQSTADAKRRLMKLAGAIFIWFSIM